MNRLKSKKSLLGICFFGLFISSSYSQILNDYRTKASGVWSDFTTVWERHNGTAWVAATASPTNTANIVTILSTHTITVAGATTVDQFTIANGGAIIINSGITLTIANGTTDLTIASGGSLTNNGTLTLNLSTASTNSGTIINSGTITTIGSLTHSATGIYRHNFSSAAATVGVIPTSTWNVASTCEILACGNTGLGPTGLNQAFGNFIWNNSTQPSDISFLGTMSIPTTGNFTLSNTNGFSIILVSTAAGGATSIGGNFTISNGNITIIKVNNVNKTNQLSITGTYTQTGGTMTVANCTGSLAGNTANGTLTIGGVSNISGGTLNVNTSSWVGAGGNGTLTAGGLITLSGTGVINGCSSSALGSTGVAGTITTPGITVNAGGVFNVNNSSTTGGGGSTIVNSSALVTVSGGTINLASGGAVATNGCNGTINANLGFTISSGTLNLSSSSTSSGGGNGTLNVSASNFVHSGGTVSKTGLNSGTININGSTAQTIRSAGFSSGDAITFNISQNTAITGTTSINTILTIANGTTFNINDNSTNTVDFTANIAITNNGAINLNTNAELDMGLLVMSGTGNFNSNTNSLLITKHATGISSSPGLGSIQVTGTKSFASDGNYTYNGTVAQVTGDGLPNVLNGGILTINNTSAVTTAGVTLTRATTILEGASTTGSLVLTLGRFITTATNLLTLGDDVTAIGGAINRFVDGPIKKIGDDAFIFPTGDVYTNNVPTLAAKWARIEIAAPTSITDAFTAEYHKVNDPCNVSQVISTVNGPGIDHVSYKEYWDLTRDAGTSTPHVKLYWADGSTSTSIGSAISSTASTDLHIAEFYSGQWNDKGAGALTGTTASGTLFTSIIPDFTTSTIMNFTFSSVSGVNPLPVELLSFTGSPVMNGNQLDWTTATETNNDYFNLERSNNGIEFTPIATIDGNGNSNSINNYKFLDSNPYEGVNYYRLKQTDYNGDYFYSNIISIENTNTATVLVYPNPSKDIVTVDISENFESLRIYNMLGEVVYENISSQTKFQFNPIADGIYVIKAITTQGKEITTRFIKN